MTLGNVGRASSEDFAGKRKLLLVPYVLPVREEQELRDLVSRYWEEALAQVRRLEAAFGPVSHIFHEGLGDEPKGVEALEQGNPSAYPYLREAVDKGAVVEPTEDTEALYEELDLYRCLTVVQASRTVQQRLIDWLNDARRRRYEGIGRRVSERMAPDGLGLIVLSPDHHVQWPDDIEVVYVAPPALNEVNRWLRDHAQREQSQQSGGRGEETEEGTEGEQSGDQG